MNSRTHTHTRGKKLSKLKSKSNRIRHVLYAHIRKIQFQLEVNLHTSHGHMDGQHRVAP